MRRTLHTAIRTCDNDISVNHMVISRKPIPIEQHLPSVRTDITRAHTNSPLQVPPHTYPHGTTSALSSMMHSTRAHTPHHLEQASTEYSLSSREPLSPKYCGLFKLPPALDLG